ncbi:MAG: SLC13 family permease [Armatimonadota bacterium]|nr:SLC13 family permease [Armatimonadota bacterium]MDR5697655.1 SLC13 family permease [Armatimonadota bacterium]
MDPMTPEITTLLVLLAIALVLFSLEWVSVDVTALGLLLALVLTGLVPAEGAFAGFGSDTVMTILGLLVLTAALLRTGVVEMVGRAILRRAGDDGTRLLILIMVPAAALSAFINNTAATAFFLPVVVGLASRARMSPSRLLMPLAFATILASSVTLVATSTNLVVSGLLTQYRMPPIGVFELTPVGLPIAIAGIAYMLVVGRRLIPERVAGRSLTEDFGLGAYLSEAIVLADSPLVGRTLAESGLGQRLDLQVVGLVRDKNRYQTPRADTRLQPGDVLLVEGARDEILKIKDTTGIEIKADVKLSDPDLALGDVALVEALVVPRSRLIGRTLKGIGFRERYGLQVLAINRYGSTIRRKISQLRLQMGDALLLQGPRDRIAALANADAVRVLGAVGDDRPNVGRAPMAVFAFAAALVAGAAGVVALPAAVLAAAVVVFATRCITPEEAYREVDWKVLILIGSMLALGTAMEQTGTARYLAGLVVEAAGDASPLWLLSGFFVLTVVLTQPMSNQAAAVVVLPVAIQTALQLDLNPRTFAVAVAVAASCSYLTPLEPACLMVYGPGRYRFVDFLRVGGPLTLLVYAIAILLVPLMWPFR